MRKITSLIIYTCLFLNMSCAQNKNLVKKTPFTVDKSYFTSWISEDSEPKRGTSIFISIAELPEEIELKAVYFRDQQASLQALDNRNIYKAEFYSGKKDYILDSNPVKEQNNPIPQIDRKPPVQLNKNQALLIYKESGKTKYYLLEKLQNKGTKGPPPALLNKKN